jgi:hypothetical protein
MEEPVAMLEGGMFDGVGTELKPTYPQGTLFL